ncbi:MAG: TIGR01777 family protein [Roseiflexaceae bacterium]|nr:TIGR01777 family protein [Roseiflexaceae bacterium]
MPKRIVVTGATGLIGRGLCAALIGRGDQVVVFSRNPGAARDKVAGAAEYVAWDAAEDGAWASALDGADAVVNLGASSLFEQRWTDAFKREIRDSRVIGTRGIVGAIGRATRKPAVLVNASAVGIYGNRVHERLDESSSLGHDFLANVCREWEAEATKAAPLGTRVVLLRTGIVLDPGEGALKQLMLPFQFGIGGPVLPGTQWISWIHRADEVDLILQSLDDPGISGPLNATAPNPQTNAQFSRVLGVAMGRPSWIPVPGFAVRAVIGGASETVTNGQYVLPAKALAHGYRFRFENSEAALRDLLRG